MQLLKRIFAVDAAVVNGGVVVTGLVISAVGDLRNLSAVGAGNGGGCGCGCAGGGNGDEAEQQIKKIAIILHFSLFLGWLNVSRKEVVLPV